MAQRSSATDMALIELISEAEVVDASAEILERPFLHRNALLAEPRQPLVGRSSAF